jgi:putative Holliday junction resolvase
MRWIGVDPGAARVGIAACDEDERVAVPLEVVPTSVAVPAIRTHVAREGAGGVVIGLPLSLDGHEGPSAVAARKLGERVRRVLSLPVEYEDERFTSVAAGEPGRGGRPRDDIAAAILLQQFIDRRRRDAEPGS